MYSFRKTAFTLLTLLGSQATSALEASRCGTGVALALPSAWALAWDRNGTAFREAVSLPIGLASSRLARAGFDCAAAWSEDLYGTILPVSASDLDRLLLPTWLRTGQWMRAARSSLQLAPLQWQPLPPHPSVAAQEPPAKARRRSRGTPGGGAAPGPEAAQPPAGGASSFARLSMRLAPGLGGCPGFAAVLWVALEPGEGETGDGSAGRGRSLHVRPLRLELPTSTAEAQAEAWVFEPPSAAAAADGDDGSWAGRVLHILPTGQTSVYDLGGGDPTLGAPTEGEPRFQPPPPQPGRAAFGALPPPPPLEAARCEGGQFIVRGVVLDGPAASLSADKWWLLDSACDSAAIAPSLADSAALPRVGAQSLPGVGGPVASAMRLAPALRAGPLTLPQALMQELSLDGAVRPPPGAALGGVLGGALWHRSVVVITAERRRPGAPSGPRVGVAVHDPAAFAPSPRVAVAWQEAVIIDGAPYVRAGFDIGDEAGAAAGSGGLPPGPHSSGFQSGFCANGGLFKLALGAGGTGVVLASAVARRLAFGGRSLALEPTGLVSGPGAAQPRLLRLDEGSLLSGRLACVELAGARFTQACGRARAARAARIPAACGRLEPAARPSHLRAGALRRAHGGRSCRPVPRTRGFGHAVRRPVPGREGGAAGARPQPRAHCLRGADYE